MDASGRLIEDRNKDILWVQAVFDMEEGHRKDHYNPLPKIHLPLYSLALGDVVKSLINTIHDNFMAGVFTIG